MNACLAQTKCFYTHMHPLHRERLPRSDPKTLRTMTDGACFFMDACLAKTPAQRACVFMSACLAETPGFPGDAPAASGAQPSAIPLLWNHRALEPSTISPPWKQRGQQRSTTLPPHNLRSRQPSTNTSFPSTHQTRSPPKLWSSNTRANDSPSNPQFWMMSPAHSPSNRKF